MVGWARAEDIAVVRLDPNDLNETKSVSPVLMNIDDEPHCENIVRIL